jgi:hypothetical protein
VANNGNDRKLQLYLSSTGMLSALRDLAAEIGTSASALAARFVEDGLRRKGVALPEPAPIAPGLARINAIRRGTVQDQGGGLVRRHIATRDPCAWCDEFRYNPPQLFEFGTRTSGDRIAWEGAAYCGRPCRDFALTYEEGKRAYARGEHYSAYTPADRFKQLKRQFYQEGWETAAFLAGDLYGALLERDDSHPEYEPGDEIRTGAVDVYDLREITRQARERAERTGADDTSPERKGGRKPRPPPPPERVPDGLARVNALRKAAREEAERKKAAPPPPPVTVPKPVSDDFDEALFNKIYDETRAAEEEEAAFEAAQANQGPGAEDTDPVFAPEAPKLAGYLSAEELARLTPLQRTARRAKQEAYARSIGLTLADVVAMEDGDGGAEHPEN